MGSPIVWFEVLGTDADTLHGFYGELFGWKFDTDNPKNYGVVAAEEGSIPGGVGEAPKGPGWVTFYVGVDDLDRSIEQVRRLGGTVVVPPTDMPDGGRIAAIADPEGHVIGLARNA